MLISVYLGVIVTDLVTAVEDAPYIYQLRNNCLVVPLQAEKCMPDHGWNRTYNLGMLAQCSKIGTSMRYFGTECSSFDIKLIVSFLHNYIIGKRIHFKQ